MPPRAPQEQETVTTAELERRHAKVREVLARVDQRYGKTLPQKVDPAYERLHREAENLERRLSQ